MRVEQTTETFLMGFLCEYELGGLEAFKAEEYVSAGEAEGDSCCDVESAVDLAEKLYWESIHGSIMMFAV